MVGNRWKLRQKSFNSLLKKSSHNKNKLTKWNIVFSKLITYCRVGAVRGRCWCVWVIIRRRYSLRLLPAAEVDWRSTPQLHTTVHSIQAMLKTFDDISHTKTNVCWKITWSTAISVQGDHFPEHMRFPDFSSWAGKDSSVYCWTLWSIVVASRGCSMGRGVPQ